MKTVMTITIDWDEPEGMSAEDMEALHKAGIERVRWALKNGYSSGELLCEITGEEEDNNTEVRGWFDISNEA